MPNHVTNILEFNATPARIRTLMREIQYDDGDLGSFDFEKGEAKATLEKWQDALGEMFRKGKGYTKTKKLYRDIMDDFGAIKLSGEKKIKVGIVGEIYVKYSPLANNRLEEFLFGQDCEVMVPGLLGFINRKLAEIFLHFSCHLHILQA